MVKNQGRGSGMDYTPNRSPVKHIAVADDTHKTKFTDDVYHDMDDAGANIRPFNV